MTESFSLIIISAWNDSGGGYTHRLFDNHSELNCWPFEIQLGTEETNDGFTDWFHNKYRWPVFSKPLGQYSVQELFDSFIDNETKQNIILAGKDKFKDFPLNIEYDNWLEAFSNKLNLLGGLTRSNVILAYLASFFQIWKECEYADFMKKMCIGHCPDLILDADQIFQDFPNTKIIHVHRSPYSGFYDLRLRRPEITIEGYCKKWSLINQTAYYYSLKYPQNVKLLPYHKLLSDPEATLRTVVEWLGISYQESLLVPTWDGRPLKTIQPFGGVQEIDPEYEKDILTKLKACEQKEISQLTKNVRDLLSF